jgi:hypothetical protein
MRYLAVELAPSGVRINAVAPAIVETDAVRTLFGAEAAGLVRATASHNPSGRGVTDADYTNAHEDPSFGRALLLRQSAGRDYVRGPTRALKRSRYRRESRDRSRIVVKGVCQRLAPPLKERTAPHRSGKDPRRRDVTACRQRRPGRRVQIGRWGTTRLADSMDVRFSIAVSSSAPLRTITTESQIQVMKPTTAPKEP